MAADGPPASAAASSAAGGSPGTAWGCGRRPLRLTIRITPTCPARRRPCATSIAVRPLPSTSTSAAGSMPSKAPGSHGSAMSAARGAPWSTRFHGARAGGMPGATITASATVDRPEASSSSMRDGSRSRCTTASRTSVIRSPASASAAATVSSRYSPKSARGAKSSARNAPGRRASSQRWNAPGSSGNAPMRTAGTLSRWLRSHPP